MNIFELLQKLSAKNIRLKLIDGALSISAPKGAMTNELQINLKENKEELVNWLEKNRRTSEVSDELLSQVDHDSEGAYEAFPLSDLQVAFYMANDPFMEFQVRPHYYMEKNYRNLNITRYEAAWDKALKRHRKELVLITDEKQLALIKDLPDFNIEILDLTHLDTDKIEKALIDIREEMMRSELPIDRWPWFDLRISVWKHADNYHQRIHFNNNNFYSDGLGTTGLLNEVLEYYNNPLASRPPIEIGFRDAVLALEKLNFSEKGLKAQDYWLKKIPSLPTAPEIPLIPGKDRRIRVHMNRREFFVDSETWSQFKQHASYYNLTSSNAVLTIQARILSAFSGNKHFIISHMMTRRLPIHHQVKEILGNFASLYPLEIDFRHNKSVAEQAVAIQNRVMEDSAHTSWGGMKVMRELNKLSGEMGASPSPFVVGSGIFMGTYDKPDFSCLETSQTLLDHQFWELTDGRFYGVWDLLEEFFPPGLIDSMWLAYKNLFLALAEDPKVWQKQNLLITPEQDLQSRIHLNQSETVFDGGLLHTPLTSQSGNLPAVITRGVVLNYEELNVRSDYLASILISGGLQPGERVAVIMERDNDLVVVLAGILKAGGAYVPVNPELPQQRKQFLLDNSGASLLIAQGEFYDSLQAELKAEILNASNLEFIEKAVSFPKVSESELAYIIYTSGSTGVPKGVAIDHKGAVNTIQDVNRKFSVSTKDRFMAVSAYSFDLSVYDVFGAWEAGACIVYPDPESAFNPTHWLELMQHHEVTVWNSAPALMSLLAEAADRQNVMLPTLRLVLLSGDWIPLRLPEQIKRFAPSAKIISLGGATEASIWSIYYPIDKLESNWLSVPYGWPMANQTWQILDEQGDPVPIYTSGELYIGGKGLAVCYWNDEEKTAKSFAYHPKTGERLYKTGDRGRYLPDGTIEFLGRLDSQVKIQGHRIELGEIESALRDTGQIEDCIVLAQEGKDKYDKYLVAHVIASNQISDNEQEDFIAQLERKLSDKLPFYMIPKSWNVLMQFPVTANGKVDRKALSKVQIAELQNRSSALEENLSPQSEMEKSIHGIWREVLGHSKFGISDDFFEIGGQSFDAVRIAGLIQERIGLPMSLGDIWRNRTVSKIAEYCHGGELQDGESCLVLISQKCEEESALFMVHPAGGYCIRYRDLAAYLPFSVYGLQAPGTDGRSKPLTSISAMAKRYIYDIKTKQKNGPFRIGGWSSGGLIAFEIASQLRAAGDRVEELLIIDCPSPHEHAPVSDYQMLEWFLEDMEMNLPLHILKGKVDDGMNAQNQLSQAVDILNAEVGTKLDAYLLAPIYQVFSSIVKAGRNYFPTQIDVPIALIRAKHGVVSEFSSHPYTHEPEWGWSRLSYGCIRTKYLPGSHHTVLTSKNVKAVAEYFLSEEVADELY